MKPEYLKKIVSKTPQKSGVYFFRNSKNKPLYIGKAFNLKNRISYYLKTGGSPANWRIQKMVAAAKKINCIQTDSDIEALILESQYIKKYKPPFNIMLRDDKQYFYVGFSNENFPKVFITHQPHSKYRNIEVSSFVGPFTDGTALKTTLRYLRRIFPYCTCKKPHNNYCLNYHIGKCLGLCCLKNPDFKTSPHLSVNTQRSYYIGKYKINIAAMRHILGGKKNSLLKKLKREMKNMAEKGKLEEAIELHGKLEKLKRVFENAKIIRKNEYTEYFDIWKYQSDESNEGILRETKKIFNLPEIPRRIEAYDIANIQGKYAVGAMVVFTDRKPDKREYRRFKIKIKDNSNDAAMLEEVLIRRFNRPEWQCPDLIIIDGGKAQFSAAQKIIYNLQFTIYKQSQNYKPEKSRGGPRVSFAGFQIPKVVALTKNKKHKGEKIYIAGRKNSIPLSQLPTSVKNLLLQVNSEAHRFAIAYYRKLHRNNLKSG